MGGKTTESEERRRKEVTKGSNGTPESFRRHKIACNNTLSDLESGEVNSRRQNTKRVREKETAEK